MFGLEVLKKGNKFKKPLNFISEYLRFLSTEEAVCKNIQTAARRHSKNVTSQSLKPLKENFLRSLFSATVHKSMFQYPNVFRDGDTDTVLNQTSEAEAYFNSNSKAEITEETISKLRELELFGLSIAQKYGGAGYTETEVKFLLECAGHNPRIARFLGYNDLCCKVLELYGSEAQKEKYLPRLAKGKSFIAFAYLENGPLIDFSKFEGTAITMEEEKKFILNADKKWVHNADLADVFLVMVKSASCDTDSDDIKLQNDIFIVDRETSGVTVHKLIHNNTQDCDLYDVTFKDVMVPFENKLGGPQIEGFNILKSGLSHGSVTDAAVCCCFMKRIIHYVSQFVHQNGLHDTSVRGNSLIQENLANLSLYTFGLESAIYFVTGRFDTYENPDLFNESILVKILAVDFLQIAIKTYIDIVGRESFKKSGILEEALQTLHYFTVFDENIEYLKMLVAADGLIHAGSVLQRRVQALRKPYDHPWEGLKQSFTSEERHIAKWKSKHNYKMEFPSDLTISAEILENNCAILQRLVEFVFGEYGSAIMNNDHYVNKFAEVAAYLYALIASLARASNSVCYGFEGSKNDLAIAQAFACVVDAKINALCNENLKHSRLTEYYRILGKNTFNEKEYPVEHPLSRTY